MAAEDKRIPELPPITTTSGSMKLAIYDDATDTTYHIELNDIIPAAATQDYRWNPAIDYAVGEIVTSGGKLWESLVTPNLNNIPLEGAGFWTERSKSQAGFALWQAGVFTDANVYVLKRISTQLFLFELIDPTRPFNSVNFDAELIAGQWRQFGSLESIQVMTNVNPIGLDMLLIRELIMTSSHNISADTIVNILNAGTALRLTWFFNITNESYLEFGASVKMADIRWDSVTKRWMPQGLFGDYMMTATKKGAVWFVEISPSIFV